jgi:hypothetical protein
VDKDGMPDAYAPPFSETEYRKPLPPLNRVGKDGIKNAIKQHENAFSQDPAKPWYWAGVVHKATGPHRDTREFLKDHRGDYPVINASGDYQGWYLTQTKLRDERGNAVHAGKVPFGVLNGKPDNGIGLRSAGVNFGDCGVVFRLDQPVAQPFLFADLQGERSPACKEFSLNVANALGRNVPVGVLVFVGSALRNDRAETASIVPQTVGQIMRLNAVDNFDSFLEAFVGTGRIVGGPWFALSQSKISIIRQGLTRLGLFPQISPPP